MRKNHGYAGVLACLITVIDEPPRAYGYVTRTVRAWTMSRPGGVMQRRVAAKLVLLCAGLLCAAIGPARADERLALVLGNSHYRNVPALANPGNDARLIASALEGSGFTLIGNGPQIDVTRPQLEALIREFGRRLTPQSVAVFYFAGHAVQIGGKNYLIPVEANVTNASDVKYELVDADFVLDEMTAAGSQLNLLLLDACRNNPFQSVPADSTPAAPAAPPAPQSLPTATRSMDICPADYMGFPSDGPALACGCTADASKPGFSWVFGDLVYSGHSSLCLAARHAGIITGRGGQIMVYPSPAPDEDPPFPSIKRNGIQSAGSTGLGTSFRVSAVGAAPAPLPAASSPSMRVMEFCPQNYHEFRANGPSLTCGCTVEASTPGFASVFGDKVYAGNSSLCLAAPHAGAVTGRGGKIIVTPVATPDAEPPFPSVLRNGIQSASGAPLGPSFQVSSATPPVTPPVASPAAPVQAPIAETLRAQGRVQVYINFDTDKATLQPTADPVLQQLLGALNSRPDMRIELVGHTDAVGSAAHNLDLSTRRAATVLTWLVQHGVAQGRLQYSGRGFAEPIAENGTEIGRAMNRRVEVKVVN